MSSIVLRSIDAERITQKGMATIDNKRNLISSVSLDVKRITQDGIAILRLKAQVHFLLHH